MRHTSIHKIREEVDGIHKGVSGAFAKVRDELNVHLDSINQNTVELNLAYQYIAALESKIEKLSERLDELSVSTSVVTVKSPIIAELSIREQELFLALYTAKDKLSATSVARLLGLSIEQATIILAKIEAKGVPIKKELFEEEIFFYLEREFKDLQARNNLVPIHESVLRQRGVEEILY